MSGLSRYGLCGGGIEMSDRPNWDDQFAESEDERNERLAAHRKARLVFDKERRTIVDPRDPDHSRIGHVRSA